LCRLRDALLALAFNVNAKLNKHLKHCLLGSRSVLDVATGIAAHGLLEELLVVGVGKVIVEVVGSIRCLDGLINTNVDVGDCHLILCESSCLVRADVVCTSHDFAGCQLLHEVLVNEHLLNRVSKSDHDSKGETLRHSDDDDGNGNKEIRKPVNEVLLQVV